MLLLRPCMTLICLGLTQKSVAQPTSDQEAGPWKDEHARPNLRNVNYIFNTILDSMRQWGSSYHHNGMSVFLATVPGGTQFYHGTHQDKAVEGIEWLAFEPEHAINFARARGPPRPPAVNHAHRQGSEQTPLGSNAERPPSQPSPLLDLRPNVSAPGYLHTYAVRHDLSLLYLDGMSAGKVNVGTLDTQDYLLLGLSKEGDKDGRFGEQERAAGLCELAQHRWHNRIDGFIRMEAGFEIILCDFARHLHLTSAVRTKRYDMDQGHKPPPRDSTMSQANSTRPPPHGMGGIFSWLRGISARHNGIGGDRVRINYENFITAYAYDIDIFVKDNPDDEEQAKNDEHGLGSVGNPRLNHVSNASLAIIRQDIDELILGHDNHHARQRDDKDPLGRLQRKSGKGDKQRHHRPTDPLHDGLYGSSRGRIMDYQASADMLVTRYADALLYLSSVGNLTVLTNEIFLLYEPFIDFEHRDTEQEIGRCIHQSLPMIHSRNDRQGDDGNDYGRDYVDLPPRRRHEGHDSNPGPPQHRPHESPPPPPPPPPPHHRPHDSPRPPPPPPPSHHRPLPPHSPPSPPDRSHAYQAIHSIAHTVCQTLHSLMSLPPSDSSSSSSTPPGIRPFPFTLSQAHMTLHNLTTYLDWSTFTECRPSCAPFQEICYIPIWPFSQLDPRSDSNPDANSNPNTKSELKSGAQKVQGQCINANTGIKI